ncbi:MAG: hypothetical protein IKO06_05875 [Alphaproteobacteria bacterium]|nr:hypothetical protein [Alphaproteobacteria bacterium]
MLEDYHSFSNKFLDLSYLEQIKFIEALNKEAGETDGLDGRLSFYFQEINRLTGSDYEEGIFSPLALDEKRLIRMDCYGSISRRRNDQLSKLYLFFKYRLKPQKHALKEYDLDNSPMWKVMAQFESFRKIKQKIRKALHRSRINPDALKIMTISDYCDVIYNEFSDGGDKARFLEPEDTVKNRFVREFMKKCGKQFEKILLERGIDERCVKSLCRKMRRYGSCDLDSLVVTEIYYTPQVISNLKKIGFDTKKAKVGARIPEELVEHLMDVNQDYLLEALNPDGSKVYTYQLPRLELHHNRAVNFADSEYLASTNYPNHLVLVESKMHHGYYHLFDSVVQQNDLQNFYARLNIKNEMMRLRIGFSYEDALFCDFENIRAFKDRAAKDQEKRVNYFVCQQEQMDNVIDIVNKYNLEINQFGSRKTQNFVRKIKPSKISPTVQNSGEGR